MVTCGESWKHLGKIEAKVLMGSDSVLIVEKNEILRKMRFA